MSSCSARCSARYWPTFALRRCLLLVCFRWSVPRKRLDARPMRDYYHCEPGLLLVPLSPMSGG
jgi:hypothetical protein